MGITNHPIVRILTRWEPAKSPKSMMIYYLSYGTIYIIAIALFIISVVYEQGGKKPVETQGTSLAPVFQILAEDRKVRQRSEEVNLSDMLTSQLNLFSANLPNSPYLPNQSTEQRVYGSVIRDMSEQVKEARELSKDITKTLESLKSECYDDVESCSTSYEVDEEGRNSNE